ncbi:MAG: ROK family transcriptional regulator [Desulfobacterales bacterium]|nr:ROK family transcriptional regulator [Desulfobacterales bacterium]
MKAANRDLMRAINRFKILHEIRTRELISRVDIARATGLSQSSVTGITAGLIKEGLLLEREAGESLGGRRPILLSLNPDGGYAVGVYISIYQISVVLINLQAAILSSYTLPLRERSYTPEAIADKIAGAVQACIWESNFSRDRISGIGVAIPGLVDSQTGMVRFLPNYRWENVNLRDMVRDRIDHPTYIENSANTLALAEQWFGEGRGVDDFILLTLEHGVGMGVVINGRLYRGQKGTAGEFGHVTMEPDGPVCRCGKKGCLEAIVGNFGILRDARAAAAKGEWRPRDPGKIAVDEVAERARQGEPRLCEIYAKAGQVLGIGVSNLIEILNPAKIIISGKGVEVGDLLFDPMREAISRYTSARTDDTMEIIIQAWNQKNYARGAGTLVLQEIYKSPANQAVPII